MQGPPPLSPFLLPARASRHLTGTRCALWGETKTQWAGMCGFFAWTAEIGKITDTHTSPRPVFDFREGAREPASGQTCPGGARGEPSKVKHPPPT